MNPKYAMLLAFAATLLVPFPVQAQSAFDFSIAQMMNYCTDAEAGKITYGIQVCSGNILGVMDAFTALKVASPADPLAAPAFRNP